MTERSVTLSRLISVKGAKDCFCDSIIRVPCRASVCLSAHQSTVVRNLVIRKQVGEEDKLQASEENYSAFNRLCPPLLHSQLPSSRPPSLPPPPPVLPPLAFSPRRSPVSPSPSDIITIDDSPPQLQQSSMQQLPAPGPPRALRPPQDGATVVVSDSPVRSRSTSRQQAHLQIRWNVFGS